MSHPQDDATIQEPPASAAYETADGATAADAATNPVASNADTTHGAAAASDPVEEQLPDANAFSGG